MQSGGVWAGWRQGVRRGSTGGIDGSDRGGDRAGGRLAGRGPVEEAALEAEAFLARAQSCEVAGRDGDDAAICARVERGAARRETRGCAGVAKKRIRTDKGYGHRHGHRHGHRRGHRHGHRRVVDSTFTLML